MERDNFAWVLGLKFLSVIILSVVAFGQNDVTTGWTFSSGGYLAFSPNLTMRDNQRIGLSFRTKEPHGLLFCHIPTYYNKTRFPLLQSYRFCAELYRGYLRIIYVLNDFTFNVTLGKALNDDRWHEIEVFLNTTSGILEAALDRQPKQSEILKAYLQNRFNPRSILDWQRLDSVVLYGGLGKSKSPFAYSQFIGCMRDLKYLHNGVFWEIKTFSNASDVTRGCVDRCVQDNPCEGGGRCINKYDRAVCDCFGTGREGDTCQIQEPTEVTLQGFEWLTFDLYQRPEDRVAMENSRYSLQFKSERASGVLLYAVGNIADGMTGHTHVIASVHNGVVKASVAFSDRHKLEQEMGVSVNDNKWHNLTIIHRKTVVEFYLDGLMYRKVSNTSNYYLNLDPKVYIGGGDNLVKTVGLQVTRNFVGCLRNVYVNDASVLYQLSTNVTTSRYLGGHQVQYGCNKVQNVSMTFPKSGTTLLLNGYTGKFLSVSFDLRTVRDQSIIFYTQLETITLEGNPEYLVFEVWIHDRMPLMKFIPLYSDKRVKTSRVPMEVSNNQWNSLSIIISGRQVKVAANYVAKTYDFEGTVESTGHIVIGYGSRNYDVHDGFVGCLRNIVINGEAFDPIERLNSPPSPGDIISGVFMDSCHLIDYCQDTSPCQHLGKCLSDWMGVSCDCSRTDYMGKTCQFSKYRASCDGYYQAGSRDSGVYIIDVDGDGPLNATYVQCIMGYPHNDELFGKTIIEHNLAPETQIRGDNMADMRMIIKYRELSLKHLLNLTTKSVWCQQKVQYNCYNAPLRLGDRTTFKAASGQFVDYLGHSKPKSCPCSQDNKCVQGYHCNCDAGMKDWRMDQGYNKVNVQLPITEVTVLQNNDVVGGDSNGTLTLGPLECWANGDSLSSMAVTFKSQFASLQLKGMDPSQSGILSFSFRTFSSSATLLHQTGASSNTNNFKITLMTGHLLQFDFKISGATMRSDFHTDSPINDGEWHLVMIEISNGQIRCSLDLRQNILDLPGSPDSELQFAGALFLGATNDMEDPTQVPGLVGCVKGIRYNGATHDLTAEVDQSMTDIVQGCTPYCKIMKPCMNNARCVEKWDGYECVCSNKWAHSGHNCEININENVATFSGSPASYLDISVGRDPTLIDSTILLSFRSRVHRGLLFYMYDDLNNFIQLEVKTGYRLVLSFNQFQTIMSREVKIPDIADGEWKQVVIETLNNGNITKLTVNDDESQRTIFPFRRFKLTNYHQNPFTSRETVVPERRPSPRPPFVRILVGGADVNSTSLANFKGCIRGLKVRDQLINLQSYAERHTDVRPECLSGCASSPCKNSGICTERWGNQDFECNCENSDYTGKTCDMEASGVFDGSNGVEYQYRPYGSAVMTTSEEFSFVFKSNCTEEKLMLLTLWCASKEPSHGYIVVTLHPKDGVMVQWGADTVNRLFRKEGQFCDGTPHRLTYRRNVTTIYIGIDRTLYGAVSSGTPMKGLDTVILGGIVHSHSLQNVEVLTLPNVRNFTGCLSDVIFIPARNSMRVRPMKELRELKNGSVSVYGSDIVQCSPLTYDPSTVEVTTRSTTKEPTQTNGLTMPPWNPGAAVTHYLNGKPLSKETTPITTTTTVTTTTKPVTTTKISTSPHGNLTGAVMQKPGVQPLDEFTIVLAVSLIATSVLIAVIIAIILLCIKRRQHKYYIKHVNFHRDYELKQPLHSHSMVPSPPLRPHSTHMPLATFDEFSMVSATLGPSLRRKENGFTPGKIHTLPADIRNVDYPVQRSFQPLSDQDADIPNIYSKKKNRPASSISEVLEEMERQRKAKELGVDPDTFEDSPKSARSSIHHGEGELEWDPQTDRTPLTVGLQRDTIYEEYLYKFVPPRVDRVISLPHHLVIMENPDEDETMDSSEDRISCSTDSSDPLQVLEEQSDLTQECNGDSGYEAESQRNGEDDQLLVDHDTADTITPPTPDDSKMYYDISCLTYRPHDSPNFASTPRKLLIDNFQNDT